MGRGGSGNGAAGGGSGTGPPAHATWAPAPERAFRDADATTAGPATVTDYPLRAREFDTIAAHLDRHGESVEDAAPYDDGKAHPVLDIEPAGTGLELRTGGRGLAVLETDLADDAIIEAFNHSNRPNRAASPSRRSVGTVATGDASDPTAGGRSASPTGWSSRRRSTRAEASDGTSTWTIRSAHSSTGSNPRVYTRRVSPFAVDDAAPIAEGQAVAATEANDVRYVLGFQDAAAAASYELDPDEDPPESLADRSVTVDGRTLLVEGTNRPE